MKEIKNVGILLSAGYGNRFSNDILKQLYIIDDLPMILYSLKVLLNTLDYVVIIINKKCFDDVQKIVYENSFENNVNIIINEINDRLESINTGLLFIKNNMLDIKNIIIHDSARPFIKEKHIMDLTSKMNGEILYIQYYFNLVNGLLRKNKDGNYEETDRSEFIEICTPICANFELYEFLFSNNLKKEKRKCYEIIPLLDSLKIKYELIEAEYKYIRKITKLEDVF